MEGNSELIVDELVTVFGEPSMAEDGRLTCVPAGKKELVERVLPYCVGV